MNPTDTRAPPFAAEFDAGRSSAPAERARRRASSSMPGGSSARVVHLAQAMVHRIRRRPWTSLLVATSGGFVIGGALSFRAGRLVLVAAARHVGREFLKQLL
jgi:adenine/guanine phosphoribosyltransferase-like PRPP-binding protein